MTSRKRAGMLLAFYNAILQRRLFLVSALFVTASVIYLVGTYLLTQVQDFAFSQVGLLFFGLMMLSGFVGLSSSHSFKERMFERERNRLLREDHPVEFTLLKLSRLVTLFLAAVGISAVLFRAFPGASSAPDVATVFFGVFGSLVAAAALWLSWK